MCIYPDGSRVFMIAWVLILLSLAAQLTTVSLDKNSSPVFQSGSPVRSPVQYSSPVNRDYQLI